MSAGIDAEGLKTLSSSLRRASRDARRTWRDGLKEVGEVVAVEARVLAAESSERVAKSIRVRSSGRAGVAVVAGGQDLPIAPLLEGKGVPGSWRHPLFGNRDYWYEQKRRPYLLPAYVTRSDEVGKRLQRYVADGIERAGLEVTRDA